MARQMVPLLPSPDRAVAIHRKVAYLWLTEMVHATVTQQGAADVVR
jgi:hypothetical protein